VLVHLVVDLGVVHLVVVVECGKCNTVATNQRFKVFGQKHEPEALRLSLAENWVCLEPASGKIHEYI
jgi:predicted metal-binding protein